MAGEVVPPRGASANVSVCGSAASRRTSANVTASRSLSPCGPTSSAAVPWFP